MPLELEPGLIRALALGLPLLLCLGAWVLDPPQGRRLGGVIAATLWVFATLYPVQLLAIQQGWWTFDAVGGTLRTFPVDLWLGWAVLWGALPALFSARVPLAAILGLALLYDAAFMPLCAPIVQLTPTWWWGEAIALLVCLLPAQLLARWMQSQHHLWARASMQAIVTGLVLIWILPDAVLTQTNGNWNHWQAQPHWLNGLLLLGLFVVSVLGLWAVGEFVQRGQGTPFPYDPPARLVTTGPYALAANPMQICAVLFLLLWGAFLGSAWIAFGLTGAIYFYNIGFAAVHEKEELELRFGRRWLAYRRFLARHSLLSAFSRRFYTPRRGA